MKLKVFLLVAVFLLAAISPAGFATQTASSQNRSYVPGRVLRVENGLLSPVAIKGRITPMKLADRMAYYGVPGVSVAVINNGVIDWARGYGVTEAGTNDQVTIETLFQAASISKPVAAMGALRLVEEGKLSLDEDVNKRLTSWKVPENEFTKEQKVTLRRLLSHSAGMTVHGFRGYATDEPVPTLLQLLNGEKPANSAAVRVDVVPGSLWRYSGGGISVAQLLMMDVTGKQFPQFMQEAVLNKLEMKHSTYQQPLPNDLLAKSAAGHDGNGKIIKGKRHTYPEMAAAGLWTTPVDLAQFAIEIQKSRAGKSNKVLTTAMINQMLTVQSGDYGLGLGLGGTGKTFHFGHGGSNEGFRCQMFAYAETGQGAVVMTNGDAGSSLADEILHSIAKEYGWPDYQVREREVAQVNPRIYESYAGKYKVMGEDVTLTADNGHLFLQAPPFGKEKIELYPESETKYFITLDEMTFTFVKDDKGQVVEMVLQIQGDRAPIKGKKIS